METNRAQDRPSDELSVKEFILKLVEWWRYLVSKLVIIVLISLVGGAIGITYAYWKKALYVAELTFVMEDGKSNPLGAYAGLASQFGIDLSSGGGSGVFSGENILEFLRSRYIIEKALLSSIDVGKERKTLADLYIDINNLRETWKDKPGLSQISFPSGEVRSRFSRLQDSIIFEIGQNIKKGNLAVAKPDKKLGFIHVTCASTNENFSKAFTEKLVAEAIDFYVQTKTKRTKANVDKLQAKADSLEALLNKKTYSAAVSQDLNLNPARRLATVNTELLTRDKLVLQTMYGEIVKNLEMSRMAMSQETPIIQIVDSPILPLAKSRPGRIKCFVIGAILFGFITVSYIIIRRVIQSALKGS
ncbi:lipopolysaccharide biosynthesis protein [Chitinophaga varians]|uniref:Lipopolysaccharide biosynthesis protein n=1 Tax=Chitinophaga varians TaxID=2202339 RepID=A0A847RTU8_9BACT|nr:lipopolysaccharide biosynthesis protein [Chitinophaga varians]NLR65284.1 lipopolysaccharide biosynthesis protein [Chitinophaga varians]